MTQEALELALEALEEIALAGMSGTGQESERAMTEWHARQAWKFIGIAARQRTAIKEALREHAMREVQRLGQEIEQEPVAYWKEHAQGLQRDYDSLLADFQAQRKPLTDEEIMEKFNKAKGAVWISDFARDIEAAHGIRE